MDNNKDDEFDKKLIKEFEEFYENKKPNNTNKKQAKNIKTSKKSHNTNEIEKNIKNSKDLENAIRESDEEFDKRLIKEFEEFYESKLESDDKDQNINSNLEEFDDREYPENKIGFDEDIINEFKEIYNNLDESKEIINELNEIYETLNNNYRSDNLIDEIKYPEIELETDDLKVILTLKKDYSKIKDLNKRKIEFFKDLNDFIEEFKNTPESDDLMEYYN
ncbi:MAG: hypothetical protein ACI4VU_07585 [Methanobrevibacter sp.]